MSNDPETPMLALMLEGEVLVDVKTDPRYLNFGQLQKGEKATRELALDVVEPDKVKITGVKLERGEEFEIKRISGDAAGDSEYEVSFGGGGRVGRVVGSVVVSIDGSEVDEVRIPIRAQIVSDLRYRRSVYLVKRDGGFEPREIEFVSRSGKNVKLEEVEDESGRLELKIEKRDGGKKGVVIASVADPDADYSRPVRGSFEVHTGDGDESVVQIRYTIAERRAHRTPRGVRPRVRKGPKAPGVKNRARQLGNKPGGKGGGPAE